MADRCGGNNSAAVVTSGRDELFRVTTPDAALDAKVAAGLEVLPAARGADQTVCANDMSVPTGAAGYHAILLAASPTRTRVHTVIHAGRRTLHRPLRRTRTTSS
jgi:hypothetical protein